jgi:glycerol kinase
MNVRVARPRTIETTAMGAAYLAGLAVGYWESKREIKQNHEIAKTFTPNMDAGKRERLLHGWHRAVTAACVRIQSEE